MRFMTIFVVVIAILTTPLPMISQTRAIDLNNLKAGQIVNGFRTDAIYMDDSDRPIGGRFTHENTGFIIDLLQIQSVPQAYIYANTFTVSDMGEPHTQEHLLIGKGNKGRSVNVNDGMSLTQMNASTYQTYTDYQINTAGGNEVFYDRFADYIDTLLHPDYTEEEVAREVRNWGVIENSDKTLSIEEKGSVYNEMTSSMNNQDARVYDRSSRMLFGEAHPLSFNAGGSPEGIRKMTAADIKRYHDANYHLANMGAVISLPKSMTLEASLARFDAILKKAQPGGGKGKREFMTVATMPPYKPAKAGTIEIVEYPNEDTQNPSTMLFTIPVKTKLAMTDRVLLQNFLTLFAGDATSNLYKKFIDTTTRQVNTGAKGIYSYVDDIPLPPVYIALTDVPAENLSTEKAAQIRTSITDEVKRIVAFQDGSPELKEFNERFRNALTEYRRATSKFVNTPPGFGFRSGGYGDPWLWRARHLNDETGFKKSVTLKPQIAQLETLLASGKNFWRDYLEKWGLTTTPPYVAVAKPSPKLVADAQAEKKARTEAELANLKKRFNVADEQEAIRRYKEAYDKTSAELEALEQGMTGKFIENPPLTLDDQLEYRESAVGKVRVGDSIFDNMTGATTGLSIRLDTVSQPDLMYLAAMPGLLRGTGVIRDGKPVTFDEMSELLRKDILSLNVEFTSSPTYNRYELTLRGAGNDPAESERAVEWMGLILKSPNWTEANLPRIRDVIDQQLSGLRRRMQDPEEYWVNVPADAYTFQTRPLHLATQSFLTQAHNVFRLKWMLKDGNSPDVAKFLAELGSAKGTRAELVALAQALQGDATGSVASGLKQYLEQKSKLSASEQIIISDAAKDLASMIADVPDSTLHRDWQYLTAQMELGLKTGPSRTLKRLSEVRAKLLNLNQARMFFIGAAATRQRLTPRYSSLLSGFAADVVAKADPGSDRAIDKRVIERTGGTGRPVHVGLMAPNMAGGVIINSAPLTGYRDTSRDKIVDFLTSKLYGGYGPHAVFTKTINAGLAYSNGVSSSADNGRMRYYAERTPLLPQTLGFVVSEVKRPMTTSLVEYVTSLSFSSRAASPYEARGEAMAASMADGVTPEVVATFRRAILETKKSPNLAQELWQRKDAVYARVLPGYGTKGADVAGGTFFVIGAERQMAAYEAYLKNAEGPATTLYRLYPRDFWVVDR